MKCTSFFDKPSVLDIHELAAGKLHALLGRDASRDLYDSHKLMTIWPLDIDQLRPVLKQNKTAEVL